MGTRSDLPTHHKHAIDGLEALAQALATLTRADADPHARAAHETVSDRIWSWLEDHQDLGSDSAFASQTLGQIPNPVLDTIVAPDPAPSPVCAAWHAHLREPISQLTMLPPRFFQRPPETIMRLREVGLPLDSILPANEAVKVWFTHGRALGEPAFRRHYPAADPAMKYWETNGLCRPSPLHEDGVREIARVIRRRKTGLTECARKTVDRYSHRHDWPLWVALFSADFPGLKTLSSNYYATLQKILGKDRLKTFIENMGPQSTAHGEMSRRRRLAALPDIETLLRLDRKTCPSYLDIHIATSA